MIWYFAMTDKAEDFMVSVMEEVIDGQMEKISEKNSGQTERCALQWWQDKI